MLSIKTISIVRFTSTLSTNDPQLKWHAAEIVLSIIALSIVGFTITLSINDTQDK
jgi:hypothetical protein